MKRSGRKSVAQTPSPKKDRVYGSAINKKKSAASTKSASSIKFNESLNKAISQKVKTYNEKNPNNKIAIPTAKAVVRRGLGAYSKTHRPTISGGAPNSRTAWGLARLSAFMRKKSQSPTAKGALKSGKIKKAYIQDNDLL